MKAYIAATSTALLIALLVHVCVCGSDECEDQGGLMCERLYGTDDCREDWARKMCPRSCGRCDCEFLCDNGNCIEFEEYVCDGLDDCHDGSDESSCDGPQRRRRSDGPQREMSTRHRRSEPMTADEEAYFGSGEQREMSTRHRRSEPMTADEEAYFGSGEHVE